MGEGAGDDIAPRLTSAAVHFMRDVEEVAAFVAFAVSGGLILGRKLLNLSKLDAEAAAALSDADVALKTFEDGESFERFWRELTVTRLVERFTLYVREVVAAVLRTQPELMSDQRVPLATCSPPRHSILQSILRDKTRG